MKRIDRGYYYDVYDLGNGRVLKKKRSLILTSLFLIGVSLRRLKSPKWYLSYFFKMAKKMEGNYKRIPVQVYSVLGNPVFINTLEYEQDRCIILKDVLSKMNEDEFRVWVQDYIRIVHDMWKYGFSDLIFNFTVNTGRDKNDNLIQVDFNEITYDKEEVMWQINTNYWFENYSYRQLRPLFKEIWKEYVCKELTEEKLSGLWNSSQGR